MKEPMAKGSPASPQGLSDALGVLEPYLSVCGDPLVPSSWFVADSHCNCGRRLSSAVGNLSLQLVLFKVRDGEFGILGFL